MTDTLLGIATEICRKMAQCAGVIPSTLRISSTDYENLEKELTEAFAQKDRVVRNLDCDRREGIKILGVLIEKES